MWTLRWTALPTGHATGEEDRGEGLCPTTAGSERRAGGVALGLSSCFLSIRTRPDASFRSEHQGYSGEQNRPISCSYEMCFPAGIQAEKCFPITSITVSVTKENKTGQRVAAVARPQAARTLNSPVQRTAVPGLPANTGPASCVAVRVSCRAAGGWEPPVRGEDVLCRRCSETGRRNRPTGPWESAGPSTWHLVGMKK